MANANGLLILIKALLAVIERAARRNEPFHGRGVQRRKVASYRQGIADKPLFRLDDLGRREPHIIAALLQGH
ncbi:hypothetical protein D3C80_1676080 [compost metagenome]